MARKKRRATRQPRRNPNKPRRVTKKYRRYERLMQRFIQNMLKDLQKGMDRILVPQLNFLAENFKAEPDKVEIVPDPIAGTPQVITDADGDGRALSELISLVEAQFLGLYSAEFIRSNLNQFFQAMNIQVEEDVTREFARQNITVFPVGTEDIINNSIQNSLGKIQDLQRSTIGQIRNEVSRGLVQGQRWETIAKRISRSMTSKEAKGQTPTPFKKASNRAKFIARNEVGTALGTINKERQLASNVRLYIWQTAEDERVRPTHRALDQEIFSWEGTVEVEGTEYEMAVDSTFSSSGTIPGEPWNCRCVAIPYIPEFEEDEE